MFDTRADSAPRILRNNDGITVSVSSYLKIDGAFLLKLFLPFARTSTPLKNDTRK